MIPFLKWILIRKNIEWLQSVPGFVGFWCRYVKSGNYVEVIGENFKRIDATNMLFDLQGVCIQVTTTVYDNHTATEQTKIIKEIPTDTTFTEVTTSRDLRFAENISSRLIQKITTSTIPVTAVTYYTEDSPLNISTVNGVTMGRKRKNYTHFINTTEFGVIRTQYFDANNDNFINDSPLLLIILFVFADMIIFAFAVVTIRRTMIKRRIRNVSDQTPAVTVHDICK